MNFAELIGRVGAPDLRVYLYNFPKLTGFAFAPELVARLAGAFGPVIAGLKDSSGAWESMSTLARNFPQMAIYAGTEAFLLPILREGGAGCISASANLTSPFCAEVFRAWADGHAAAWLITTG